MAFLKIGRDESSDTTILYTKPIVLTHNHTDLLLKISFLTTADDSDYLILNVKSSNIGDDFVIGEGEFTLNLNDSNIFLSAFRTQREVVEGSRVPQSIEINQYPFTKKKLIDVCEATTVDLQFTGSNDTVTLKGGRFLNYCRKSYNELYGETYPVKRYFFRGIFNKIVLFIHKIFPYSSLIN